MEYPEKNQTPYKGCVVTTVALTAIPVILCWAFASLIFRYQASVGSSKNMQSALLLGCGLGFLFHLSCFVAGVFKESLRAIKERLREFKDNCSLSLGFAIKCYFEDMKVGGVAFLIYCIPMTINFLVFVNALNHCIKYFF